MNTLTTVSDSNKTTGVRAAALLALLQSHPNSRSNHLGLTIDDVEVYDSPVEGVGAFVETQDMETYLHVVSVITREAAMTGYAVQVNQHGWDVGFVITESVYTEAEVETEWVIVHAESPDSTKPLYYSDDNGWTPLRERATGFGSRAVAENYLSEVFPALRDPRTHVREVEVLK
jgi:hypothetical protein